MPQTPLIGRQHEQAELNRALGAAIAGKGSLLLLAGEAGVGKTRLAETCLIHSSLPVLRGKASETATPPYGPIEAIFRAYLRLNPSADFSGCGSLAPFLSLLLPELGPAPGEGDPAILFEAIRCAFEAIARREPTALFLDDLQWADNATLELLPTLAEALRSERLLIVGIYRSDEIPRGHPMRRLRNELRRARQLHEIVVEPLDEAGTALLIEQVLGQSPGPALTAALYGPTQGMPLFVEELAVALGESGRLRQGPAGLELSPGEPLPIPATLRDTVLLRLNGLSPDAVKLLEIAAVAGIQFDLGQVAELAGGEAGLDELVERRLIVEAEGGLAAFRHALTREAVYEDILWSRRRALHRQLAERLQADDAPAELIAAHWLAGREQDRARQALIISAEKSCSLHAYRDAAWAAQRALELWPEGKDEAQRLAVLDRLGHCAQLSGMLADAARAWREVAEGHRLAGEMRQLAEAQRRLAAVYELQSAWDRALTARQAAADIFVALNLPAEAATERLAAASRLQGAAHLSLALELITMAAQEVDQAEQLELKVRLLALEGVTRAKMGQIEAGRELVQTGLALALHHNFTGAAIMAYQKLATVLENAADYPGARKAYMTAFNFCEQQGEQPQAQYCIACLTGVLWRTGEWDQAISLCRDVLASFEASPASRAIADTVLGGIHAQRGEVRRARQHLLKAAPAARRMEAVSLETDCALGLAIADELEGAYEAAMEHCRFIVARWQQSEDRHYVVSALRWATTFFAGQGAEAETRASAAALATMAADNGNPESVAAFAHALGEVALLDHNAEQATQMFNQALEQLGELEAPYQYAETELRAGMAQAAAGDRQAGIRHLVNSHRLAKRLGAQPLASKAIQELANLGEPIAQHLSPRAARRLKHGNLTRRQLEVVRLIARGRTSQEIADNLVLSPRTVEMHVGHILNTLNCHTRAEAVRRAGELGLLD